MSVARQSRFYDRLSDACILAVRFSEACFQGSDMHLTHYPRDLIGYGARPPLANWPGGARIAVQFVLNVEEGGENCILHGDTHSEAHLSESVALPLAGERNLIVESFYEYGARAGFWRVLRLFDRHRMPFTCFAVGMAVQRTPDAIRAMRDGGHEIATHGYRWINYHNMPEQLEREHIKLAIKAHEDVLGERPLGFYAGRVSSSSRRLCIEEGFLYDADSYADDLPYWTNDAGRAHLVVPYTSDSSDMKFQTTTGSFSCGDQFYNYLKDTFDCLYEEGADTPKMMSVALHSRIIGRPGRIQSLGRFMNYIAEHEAVWVARRIDIARHWIEHFPATLPGQPTGQ
jgi:putative urate catabolism protein